MEECEEEGEEEGLYENDEGCADGLLCCRTSRMGYLRDDISYVSKSYIRISPASSCVIFRQCF